MAEPLTAGSAFRVLVVCAGNVCRSPLAERLIRARLAAALGGGADPDGFRARAVSADLVAGADLVLTATREHRAAVVRLHPPAHRYTFTVREFGRLAAAIPAGERPAGLGP